MVTAHFSKAELSCRHCGAMEFGEEGLEALERLRVLYARPMQISSGYRCPDHNAAISTTGRDGPHTHPDVAVDVLVHGEAALELITLARRWGFSGIGVKQHGPREGRFVHIDRLQPGRHPRPWVWSYT